MEKLNLDNDNGQIDFNIISEKDIAVNIDSYGGSTTYWMDKEQAKELITWLQKAVKELA